MGHKRKCKSTLDSSWLISKWLKLPFWNHGRMCVLRDHLRNAKEMPLNLLPKIIHQIVITWPTGIGVFVRRHTGRAPCIVSHDKSPQRDLQSELVMAEEKVLARDQHPSQVSQEERFLTIPGVVGHRGYTHELKCRPARAYQPCSKLGHLVAGLGSDRHSHSMRTPRENMPLESLPNKVQELLGTTLMGSHVWI